MIEIAGRKIGPEYPPYWIADIGANHDGSLARAGMLIGLAAEAGADAVKFQNFSAPKLVSRRGFEELGKVGHQADWEGSIYEEYEKASIRPQWTPQLAQWCEDVGVAYLTTPYDLAAVDAIDPYVPAWKIGSGDITYHELIRHVASKGKPVFLATGASTVEDVNRAIGAYLDSTLAFAENLVLMQCNTNYTGDSENLAYSNLRVLSTFSKIGWPYTSFGLSDHTRGPIAVCAAVTLGACVIEKHLTDDCSRPGPDHAFALTPDEFRVEINASWATHAALGDGVKKVEENEREAVIVQRRALRYKHSTGGRTTAEDFVATRPCPEGALEPYRINEVAGRVLKRPVEGDTLVRLEDFE